MKAAGISFGLLCTSVFAQLVTEQEKAFFKPDDIVIIENARRVTADYKASKPGTPEYVARIQAETAEEKRKAEDAAAAEKNKSEATDLFRRKEEQSRASAMEKYPDMLVSGSLFRSRLGKKLKEARATPDEASKDPEILYRLANEVAVEMIAEGQAVSLVTNGKLEIANQEAILAKAREEAVAKAQAKAAQQAIAWRIWEDGREQREANARQAEARAELEATRNQHQQDMQRIVMQMQREREDMEDDLQDEIDYQRQQRRNQEFENEQRERRRRQEDFARPLRPGEVRTYGPMR